MSAQHTDVQLYLDLKSFAGRGPEAAEFLIKEAIEVEVKGILPEGGKDAAFVARPH
ncbi:MAG: hypothetical protein HY747_11685 [Elusimicrobia bacterium]|nr:hypothetical protein [Elusimicrobiota bacterium]